MKRDSESEIDPMGRAPSVERAAWLANMLRMADRREIADPTESDIQEMRSAIGDNPIFAELSDANKALLFCALLTIRLRLRIYDELVKFEEEEPRPLLSALMAVVATIPNYHGVLSVAADEISEISEISVGDPLKNLTAEPDRARDVFDEEITDLATITGVAAIAAVATIANFATVTNVATITEVIEDLSGLRNDIANYDWSMKRVFEAALER
jgi:hypothetical protein